MDDHRDERLEKEDPDLSAEGFGGPSPESLPDPDFAEKVSKMGTLTFAITADANQALETIARLEKACAAFLRAYAEPVDMVPLDERPIDRSDYVSTGTLKESTVAAIKGPIKGKSFVLEVVDELVAESPPEAVSDPGCV